jgi:CubicO group peptidase (beta-lactamase class C family)
MSSGIPFTEPDTGNGDAHYFDESVRNSKGSDISEVLNNWQRQTTGEGKKFYYASIETAVLAEVLRGAIKQSICSYAHEKLWEPIGAENDAYFEADGSGNVIGYSGFNATQTDWAKIGVMLANMGKINSQRVLSEDYIDQATNINRQPDGFKFGQAEGSGYGYQFWLRQKTGRYFMHGSYGQYIGIDKDTKSVIVIHTADPVRVNKIRSLRTFRLFQSLIDATNSN